LIKGGYYIKARCIRESWIAHSAPIDREVWDYLLREANHMDRKYHGFIIKRGQLFRTYREIREALYWKIGCYKKCYSESAMKHCMKRLMNARMIELTKEPRGNVITVCNYDYFQDPKNYEGTDEGTDEGTSKEPVRNRECAAINKNVKNDNNKKKEPLKDLCSESENGKVTPREIYDLWNQYAVNGIPKAKKLTQSRIDKIKLRLREEPVLEYWQCIFSKLQKLPFYCGDNNRNWVVTFDYIMRNDTNHVKISERSIKKVNAKKMDYAEQEFQKLKTEKKK
jgi:hypothetical protein